MRIDPDTCISCAACADYCPMDCIAEAEESFVIDWDECVECGVCLRSGVCPTDALYMPEESLQYPRSIRASFSDPAVQFPELMQGGRGTEEMKTNDVTGKFRRGEFGMTLEFGRPGTGTRLGEIEKALRVIARLGLHLEDRNPVYFLVDDLKTGRMKPEVVNEKVLSAILEFKVDGDRLEEVIEEFRPVIRDVETVVSWGVVSRFEPDGSLPVIDRIEALGIPVRPNAKVNVGLGRPKLED